MSMHNAEIADAFDEMGDLLSIQGDSPFRIRAYQRAAQVIRGLPRQLSEMGGSEEYQELPGIGEDLAGKIAELVHTGHLRALEKLRRGVPPGVRELLKLPGMGPVRVRALQQGLHVRNATELERAIGAGALSQLRGFGPVIQSRLRAALSKRSVSAGPQRIGLSVAAQFAEPLRKYLASLEGVQAVEIAGSYRRRRDTVGDLDILICARPEADPIAALGRFGDLREISAAGRTKAACVLRNGLQVDVRVVPTESFGAALLYFTGSRDHNIHLRRIAQEKGLKLSEYGLFRGARRLAGETERQVYEALKLSWMEPELREDRGEIEAAQSGELPRIIEAGDLKGDLHVHTDASDGQDSLERMVLAARARGLSYIGITDHGKHLGIYRGLDAERLARQGEAIDALNGKHPEIAILKGAEVDILEDGRLALPDSVLSTLDLVLIAVHSHFDLPKARQTARLLRALDNPYVTILAHPSGRLIPGRAASTFDFERILEAAHARRCAIEVNGQPTRLDLDDVRVRAARDAGVLLSLGSDAHSVEQFEFLQGAVSQARRGWARREDVLNCRPVGQLRKLLRELRAG